MLTDANAGKAIRLLPDEVESYKRLRYLGELLDKYMHKQNDLQNISLEELQNKYDKLMSNASENLKHAILIADSGHAISIPPNEVELYKEICIFNL